MKRVTMISPKGDKIIVSNDQVPNMKSKGWEVESEKVSKVRAKPAKEVEDGDIQRV